MAPPHLIFEPEDLITRLAAVVGRRASVYAATGQAHRAVWEMPGGPIAISPPCNGRVAFPAVNLASS